MVIYVWNWFNHVRGFPYLDRSNKQCGELLRAVLKVPIYKIIFRSPFFAFCTPNIDGYKILSENLYLAQDFPNKIIFRLLRVKMFKNIYSKILKNGRKCALLAKDFEMTCRENLRGQVSFHGIACMYVITHSNTIHMDQTGKVTNPARGHLSREHEYFSVPIRA